MKLYLIAISLCMAITGCFKSSSSKYEGLFTSPEAVYQIKNVGQNKYTIRVFALNPGDLFAACVDDVEYSGELFHDKERKMEYITGAFFSPKLKAAKASCRSAEESNEKFKIVLNENNLAWVQTAGVDVTGGFELVRVNKTDLESYSHFYSKL